MEFSFIGKELGLLSDIEILERLVSQDDKKCIFVSPLIDPSRQLGPSSLDLRIGTQLTLVQRVSKTHIDLTENKRKLKSEKHLHYKTTEVPSTGSFVLHPGEFALAATLEYIRLPCDIAARLEGRSTVGRLGLLVHATAGFVDPGFEGNLTWELVNAGKLPVVIPPGYRIGQICFYRTENVVIDYSIKEGKKYFRSFGVVFSKSEDDPE